jgi:hypothetical protein
MRCAGHGSRDRRDKVRLCLFSNDSEPQSRVSQTYCPKTAAICAVTGAALSLAHIFILIPSRIVFAPLRRGSLFLPACGSALACAAHHAAAGNPGDGEELMQTR